MINTVLVLILILLLITMAAIPGGDSWLILLLVPLLEDSDFK